MGYPNVTAFCKALGHHGVCPEGLEVMGKVAHFLDEETREEYDQIMRDLRAMFAPVGESSQD
ncbi:hypothetical protein KEU06_09235 [Pseudaminobacter sp. 19-2017]|uniref:Uncharacterized protein n=1 Tax=Pseudaminobacter soli (ex Zhang et al. 2022) TaxID=2831468 RepID=A0A942DXF5_9HYPH|nr:hypothetical protein [Pseudaminobacter soli]MBS3648787.1 hypothetical protein [Pseudaminobacter soli]